MAASIAPMRAGYQVLERFFPLFGKLLRKWLFPDVAKLPAARKSPA